MAGAACACSDLHDDAPLLGEYTIQTQRGAPVALRVDQYDTDIKVLVLSGARAALHDGPGGRNGSEWIYLASDAPVTHEICLYPAYRQKTQQAYEVTPLPLADANEQQRAAVRRMSDASASWAANSRASRLAAVQIYDHLARQPALGSDIATHALIYSAATRAHRYQYEQALPIATEVAAAAPSGYACYISRWLTGIILNRRDDFAGSRKALEAALKCAQAYSRATGRSVQRDIADITNLLGEVHLSAGDIDNGERLIRQALLAAGDDLQLLGLIHNNLGYVHLRRADFDSVEARPNHLARSIEEHLRARDSSARAGDRLELSIIDNNLATLFERVGDLRNARRYYETALQLIDNTDDAYRFKVLYRGLGNIYLNLGDYAKSERFLKGSLTVGEQAPADQDIRQYCQLGIAHRLQSQLSAAVAAHQTCLQRASAGGDLLVQAEALHELSIDYALEGSPQLAWGSIQKAARLLPEPRDRDVRSKILTQQARLLQARGEHAVARRVIGEAISAAVWARYATTKIEALAAATSIYREQGLTDEAASFAQLAINAIEAVHSHLDAEQLGPAWSARTHDIYSQLAMDYVASYQTRRDRGDLVKAIGVVERSRAISLRQQYNAPPQVIQKIQDDPTLNILSELANRSATSQGQQAGLPLAYYHEHDLLTLTRLSGAGDLPVPAPMSVEALQQALRDGQTALVYFFGRGKLHLFVVTRSSLQLVDLGSQAEIDRRVDKVRELVSTRDTSLAGALRELSAAILPIAALPPGDEWLVVRDGSLHVVPFGALHTGSANETYKPAVARYAVKVVPSLSTYFMRKPQPITEYTADLAVFADPAFVAANVTTDDVRGKSTPTFEGWTQGLRRLPWTASEARHLAGLFPPNRTLIFTDASATRQNLRSAQARNARMLHIASHGYFHSSNPDNVGFALSPVRRPGRVESGFITLTELFSYRFNNELVVISGCDTAMGVERAGEGMLSLTRGFIVQGASHVVSTLWPVSDRVSAEFMALFYGKLVAGEPVARALSLAQFELSRRTPYRDPYFWAPYMVTTIKPDDRIYR